jgi:hypothetical protein
MRTSSVHRLCTTQQSVRRKSQHRPRANIRSVLIEALLVILLFKLQVQMPSPPAACRPAGITKRQHSQKTETYTALKRTRTKATFSLDHALLCLIVSGIAAWSTLGSSGRSAKGPLRSKRHLDIDLHIPHLTPQHATRAKSDGSGLQVARLWPATPLVSGHRLHTVQQKEYRASDERWCDDAGVRGVVGKGEDQVGEGGRQVHWHNRPAPK